MVSLDKDRIRAHWEADYRQKGRLYGGPSRQLPAFPGGMQVLDVGCGDGKSLSSMMSWGWDMTAVDFSFHAVALARKATGGLSGPGFVVADARTLPFRNNSFDAVTAVHLLGHCPVESLHLLSREIDRVLRPGGTIFAVVFSTQDFRCGTGTETGPATFIRGNGIMTHYFTEPEVTDLFPGYRTESVIREEWALRVRGKDYPRSEIVAHLVKRG